MTSPVSKPDPNYVRIFDTTLRDGEQSPGATMTSEEKKKRGPQPEVFKVPLPFKEAVKAALETKPPSKKKPKRRKRSS